MPVHFYCYGFIKGVYEIRVKFYLGFLILEYPSGLVYRKKLHHQCFKADISRMDESIIAISSVYYFELSSICTLLIWHFQYAC